MTKKWNMNVIDRFFGKGFVMGTAVAAVLAWVMVFHAASVQANDEPWFRIENGRPVYTKMHESGLPTHYGKVGKNGLVWYADFNGSLKARYINPEKSATLQSMKAQYGKWGGKLDPVPGGPQFVNGVLGQAFFAPAGKGIATAYFTDTKRFTPLKRGTLVLWMKSDEGSLYKDTFSIFNSGAGNLRHGTWTQFELAFQEAGSSFKQNVYLIGALTNDLKGWNMYAYSWDEKAIKFYANGIYVAQAPIDVGKRQWGYLSLGRVGGEASRAYDEVSIYNRNLSQSELRRQYLAILRPMSEPGVTVPRATSPVVTIDGVLDEKEWAAATKVKGFLEGSPLGDFGSGQIADPQSELQLQYDDTYLYIACRSPWPKEILREKIATVALSGALRTVAKRGDQVNPMKEDAFELLISNGAQKDASIYRVLINPGNIVSDGIIVGGRGYHTAKTDFSWHGDWKVITKETVEGEWLLEAAIPFADIGVTPKSGAPLDFNITRHWNLLKKGSEEWAWGTRRKAMLLSMLIGADNRLLSFLGDGRYIKDVKEMIPLGRLHLAAPDTPVVKIVSVGELTRGEIDFIAEVFNPSDRAVEVDFSLRTSTIDSGTYALGFILKEQTLTVPAKESSRFSFKKQVEDYAKNMLVFRARRADSKQTLVKNTWHFIREESLDIYVKKLPSAGKLAALINCSLLSKYQPSQIRAKMQLKDDQGNVQVSTISPPFSGYTYTAALDVSELAPGDYKLSVEILAGGQVVALENRAYTHNPLPDWLGNEYGWNFDKVPAPFTAVERKGNTLFAWDREYDFGVSLLPRQIRTQGWDLLREPVRLIITLGDGTVVETDKIRSKMTWNDNPHITVARQVDGKLVETEKEISGKLRRAGTAVIRSRGIKITNDFWFEYDGLLWNTLKIESNRNVTIKKMVLEVPMVEFFSQDIFPGGILPKKGYTEPLQWIGNGYGGLEPIVRSAPQEKFTSRITPSSKGATYRITLIDTQTPISNLKPIEFTLQATPVKVRSPEYRKHSWYIEGSEGYFTIAGFYPSDQMFVPAPDHYYSKLIYSGEDLSTDYKWALDFQPKPTVYAGPYFFSALNANVPEATDFKEEWLDSPVGDERISPGATTIRPAYVALSVRDYHLWRYGQLMEKTPFGGMYFDGTVSGGHANPLLEKVPGTKNKTLAERELAQRLYNLVKIPFPNGFMVDHSGGAIVDMAQKSFIDFTIDGEQDWPLHYEGMTNFKDVMSLTKFRTKFMGLNYGLVGSWYLKLGNVNVPSLWRKGQRKLGNARTLAEHAQSIMMLHDSNQYFHRYMTVGEYSDRLRNVLKKYDWGEDYLMMPYWDQDIVELPDNRYASFYVRPTVGAPKPKTIDTAGFYLRTMEGSSAKTVICIFSNESEWEGVMRVKPDWKKLGFASSKGLTVENAVHGLKVRYINPEARHSNEVNLPDDWYVYEEDPAEYVRIEGDELVFPMTPYNYRMIVISSE